MDTSARGSAVVVRFLDGRMLKGTTQDFSPHKPSFHVVPSDNPSARATAIPLAGLKAVFFVRTYEGNPKHIEIRDIARAKGQGRKIVVTFADGEVLGGFTTGYNKDKPGFFVLPVDPNTNNLRVYVVASAVKSIAFADAPAAAPVKA